jgi:uncharacterized protein YjbI with pentapeptide repeats/peptidoglycan hydrolase-like protein with peptidoglycan-binding domain
MEAQAKLQNFTLPDWLLKRLSQAANDARTAYILYASLVGYCGLTIVTTSDRQIILNETVRLPLLDLEVSLIGFFVLSPIFVIAVYLYLHLQLIRLKTLIAEHKTDINRAQNFSADPWPMEFEGDKSRDVLHNLHVIIVNISLWWLLPGLLWLFSFWIIRSHNTFVTVLNCVYLIFGTLISLYFWSRYKRLTQIKSRHGYIGRILLAISAFIFALPVLVFIILSLTEVLWSNKNLAHSNLSVLWRAWTSVDLSYQVLGSKPSEDSEEAFSVNLRGARLQAANLAASTMAGADLRESQLQLAQLERAVLTGSNFSGANLAGANLKGAILNGANLKGANLKGVNLREAILRDAILQEANLDGALLQFADLSGADLRGANLQSAKFYYANMQKADLRRATLCFADLGNTNMQEVNLGSANLKSTILVGANLQEAILRRAYLGNVQTQEFKVFGEQLAAAATLYRLAFEPGSKRAHSFHRLIDSEEKLFLQFYEDKEAVWIHLAQKALKDEGFYYGDVDRIAGPITRRALIQYQNAYGLEPTGVIDTQTRYMMRMSEGEKQIPDCIKFPLVAGKECEVEMPRSVVRGLRKLKMEVQAVKTQFHRLGYYTGEINAKYDLEFVEAVQRFQAAMDIDADGLLGEGTAGTLGNVMSGERKPIISTILAKTILQKKNHFNGTIDDKYDNDFVTALKKFQAEECLIYDGLLRQSVVDKLEDDH